MKHVAKHVTAIEVPNWSPAGEARQRIEEEIDRFIGAAANGMAEFDAALALGITAGLGKTTTALRIIARYGKALLDRGHVLFYTPTLELAERACAELKALAPGLPARVVRGRGALRLDGSGETMCQRAELARSIAGFVPSVTKALCRAEDPDGNFVRSHCATGCPYLAQKDIPGPHVVFLPHAYLTIHPPIDGVFPVVLRVVDEKVWPTLTRISHVSVEDFMRASTKAYPTDLREVLARAKGSLVDGLQRGLSAGGLTADLPLDFETEDGAKRFRRGRPTPDLVALCARIAAANGWRLTALLLRRPGGGKAVPAIILDDARAPIEMARTLWPDFTPELA